MHRELKQKQQQIGREKLMSAPKMKGRMGLLFSFIIAAYTYGVTAQTTVCENATVADIVFLIDGSSSITSFREVRYFLRSIIRALDIGPNKVRIGLAQFSGTPYRKFLLKDHVDKRSLLAAVDRFSQRGGGTEVGKAPDFLITEFFTKEAGSRADQQVPQIAVVITDGESSNDVVAPAQRLRMHGVIVFAVGVGQANQKNLQAIANWPPKQFLLTTDNYRTLQRLADSLLKTVCISVVGQKRALADRFADIFFLVDSGIGQGQFSIFRPELIKLIDQLNIGASAYRIGLAQYGEDVRVEFLLNEFQSKQETRSSVQNFNLSPEPDEPHNLGSALQYASTNLFISEAGGRAEQGSRQFLVVVSGKDSDDPVFEAARMIEAAGITVLGMNAGATMDAIYRFARYSFDSPRVTLLKDIFMAEKKDNVTEDCRGANVADIVFIVDESGRIGSQNFEPVYDFLHSIVSSLNVSANRVRIGIVTYNEMATAQAYLNTFSSKAGILQYISILPYIDILPNSKGIRNTGAALYFTEKEIFSVATGSRKGVQRVAVVITDGDSQDDVSEAAASLRRANVTIYAVGITDVKEAELVKIASHPPSRHVFTANSFTNLIPLKQELPKILCTDIISGVISVSISKTDTKEACTQKEEADVFFLMDDSGSINNTDFTDMKDFITEFLHNFHIGPNHVRMGLVKYSKSASLEFDLTTYSDAKALEEAVKKIIHEGGGTRTGDALSFMASKFGKTPRTHGYKVPEYLIVITDGESEDDVRDPAKKLREQGVIIYAVGVKNSNRKELLSMAGDPKKTFLVNNFDALKSINNDIATDICASDACKDVPLDIVFLVDSSGSISEQGYQTMKDFMKSVISKPVIGQKDVHIGVMQFSTTQKLEFSLTRYYRKDEMSDAIDAMTQLKENTLTGSAITEVSQYFDATRGGRPDVKKRLVIITDGEAQDKVERPAEALREKGVVIYAIGVQQAKRSQLLKLSGSSERVFYERDFDTLDKLEGQLVLKLCETECKRTERADIIFLVDGSGSIGSRFTSMQTFMQSVVNRTTVGRTHTQFGLILYSDDPESMFTLKTYDFKQDVLNAIMNIKAPGDRTYTGKALKFSLQYFNAEHGGRKELKVPQILMVITDGDATDHENLPAPSEALRNNGISVFSIGVENANKTELEIMAGGDKSRVFFVDNFDALETLYKNISSALCNSTKPVCDQADVVFLLDHSSSINIDNYAIMVNFTADLVQSLDVREKFVHVGLAQFSGDPKDEFYLNQYSKREDVVKRIHELEYRGGNTNIGEALRHVKKYFEVSQGSRKSANIPQNLVLISDGDSHDEVEDRGNQLRALGIEVFAIGVGDVHDLQLLQITGTAERLFSVQNFKDLATIKKKVLDSMCKPEPPINVTSCSIDIAMGFDISLRAPGGTLVSGHTKLQTFLPEIAHYVSSIPHLCCAGTAPVKTNITYQVVNRDGASLYQTEFKAYSADEVNTVMSLQMSEPTAFNTNLLNAFKETFQTKSTADVKVLLIFSDGLDEDVMKLEQQAELLQKSGVSALLIVALEGARNPAQLQMVEFGRGFSYHLPLSIGMQSVSSTILKQIDVVSHRVCCKVMCKCSGHEGVRGSPGKPGPKGLPGQKGHSGFVGDEGVMGERGRPGPSGPQGLRGCPGASGLKGSRGTSGDTGENGEDGLDGIDGEQGTTGLDGAAGEKGHLGNQGIPGIRGEAGLKGQRGLRGDPGEPGTDNTAPGAKGDPGNPGLPGQPGTDGRSGEGGVSGYPGPDGRRGSAGGKGTPGQPGALGLRGRPGAPGPQGPGGDKGDPGPKGISGFPGPQGEHGPPGDPGAAGRRGSNGQKGQPGDPGVKGAPGPQGPRGMPGEDGRDGYGTKGSKGAKGDPGFPGYPGQLGEDGVSGTKGYPGRKGNYGRSGNSGRPGASGVPGDPGRPGHRGPRGPPGSRDTSDCQLVDLIRNNCACSPAETECPAYPTELVFGLDMSQDVPPSLFERQRTALLSLLEDITVAESNCPTGARVAVVGFSAYTKYLIRFQDYRQKKQLIELVKNIAQERTSNRRQLGAAMRFVGQNVFKRVRAGVRIRKVAVFFSCGPSQDSTNIVTSIMEYQALNIIPAIISAQSNAEISRAVEVDDSRRSIFTVMGRDMAAPLRRVKNCAICYDPCRRAEECAFIQEPVQPQDVNVDLVMVVDSSREMQADEYAGAQHLLGSVVEQLAVSSQPRRADNRARVAVVQQSGTRAPKVEFSLQTYQNHNRMKTHLIQNMQQQGGSSALGQTLDFTLREVLLKASQPRRRRALLAVVGTQTAYQDRARLTYISKKVKCEGVAMFVVTVGDRYNRTQVEELAGLPVQQHLIHVSRLQAEEQGYAQRFFRVFLSALNKGVNTYPPPTFKQTCSRLEDREEALTLVNGQGSAEPEDELEEFQAQTGRKTQAIKLEVTDTLTGGHDQRPLSAANPNDACSLRQDPGSCQNYTLMWFFDSSQGKCLQFWYSGCGGNGNRFETQRECEDLCVM